MPLSDFKLARVETGITFAHECYLDPSRSQEFHDKVNSIFPNFFTRNNFLRLPERFVLENLNRASQCIVRRKSFNYSVGPTLESKTSVEPAIFLNEVRKMFESFKDLFAIADVRRIGKIYDFQSPARLTKDSLNSILRFEEVVEISNLHLLIRQEGKNINIHFRPLDKGVLEFEGKTIDVDPIVVVRCDINNIDMNFPLDIPEALTEIFEFADRYVQIDLVQFLNKYFGAIDD